MNILRIAGFALGLGAGVMLAEAASAEEPGTMDLAPNTAYAQVLPDDELAKHRGGFMGIAFSATFVATIENLTGNVTGTGSTNTSGITNTNPPATYNISGGQVELSSFIGNLSGLNGVFQLTSVNGVGNIVNSHLTLNVALVNVANGQPIPNLTTIMGR